MKRLLRITLLLITLVLILAVGGAIHLASESRNGHAPGLVAGQLTACPASPNCVNSQAATGDPHAIAPLRLADHQTRAEVEQAIVDLGGIITSRDKDYLSAEVATDLFGFVDDLELLYDNRTGLMHVRSASRVGHSDLGANRKRVEALRTALSP